MPAEYVINGETLTVAGDLEIDEEEAFRRVMRRLVEGDGDVRAQLMACCRTMPCRF